MFLIDNLSNKGIKLKHKQCEVPRQVRSPTGWCTFVISWPHDPWPRTVQVRVVGRRHLGPSLHRVRLTPDHSVFLCTFSVSLYCSVDFMLPIRDNIGMCAFRHLPYVFETVCFPLPKWNSSDPICNINRSSLPSHKVNVIESVINNLWISLGLPVWSVKSVFIIGWGEFHTN